VKTLSPRALAVIVVLLVLVGAGGILVGRSLVQPGDDSDRPEPVADVAAPEEKSSRSSLEGGASEEAAQGGVGTGQGDGAAGVDDAAVAEPVAVIGGEPVPATSASGDGYAYRDPEGARKNTGTVPPPVLPVKVKLSSTQGLRDGDPVNIRIDAEDGSQVFAFTVHQCRRDAVIRNDGDFLDAPGGRANCAANPLSPRSDGPIRVQGEGEFRSVQGTYRIGVGSDSYQTVDAKPAAITCGPQNPCKLVLKIQVPYGFGYQEFPITYA